MAPRPSTAVGRQLLSAQCSCKASLPLSATRWSSTATSAVTPTPSSPSPASPSPSPSPYRILAASLLSRPPLILPTLTPLESSYYAYQRRIHRALSKPLAASTEWFFKKGSAAEKAFQAFEGKVQKEDSGTEKGERRAWEMAGEEVEGAKEVMQRLETEADRKGDERSLERRADRTLYLVLKKERSQHAWQFPQGTVAGSEALVDAAQRKLLADVGVNVDVWPVGRVPAGAIEYGSGEKTSRVFFMPMRMIRGQASLSSDSKQKKNGEIVDFAWLTKEEIKDKVDEKYWSEVEGMLSDL